MIPIEGVVLLCLISGLVGFGIRNEMAICTLRKMREALERGELRP